MSPPVTASPWAWVAASTSPHVAPPRATARRRCGSTATEFIRLRLIISPPSQADAPLNECPPPRIVVSRPGTRPNLTAATTSSRLSHRAITAGRKSNSPFHSDRASSKPASPGSSTAPAIAPRKAPRSPFPIVVMSPSSSGPVGRNRPSSHPGPQPGRTHGGAAALAEPRRIEPAAAAAARRAASHRRASGGGRAGRHAAGSSVGSSANKSAGVDRGPSSACRTD